MKDNQPIYDILNEATRRGQKLPSLRAIRAKLGGGSLTRISEAVKAWQTQQLVDKGQLPTSFTDKEKEIIIDAIWQVVQPIMGKRIDELIRYHMARITISLNSAQRLKNEAEHTLDDAQSRILEYENKLRLKDERISQEIANSSTYATMAASLRTDMTALKKEMEALRKEREELLKANASLETEVKILKEKA